MEYKQQIVSFGKRMLNEGLVASTWGNISMRASNNIFYITPSGMDYNSLKPEDIVLIDFQGNVLAGKKKPSSELLLHLEIYKAREDINAIVHTHSLYASAFAACRKTIPPVIEDMAMVIGGSAEVAEYALPGTAELAVNAVKSLENRGAVLLANHGVVGVGSCIDEAYKAALLVEKTAHICTAAYSIGDLHLLAEKDVAEMRKAYLTVYGQK